MPFPPDVYMIGAQKSGTTFLATLLDQHPQITLSEPKEPDYFTRYYSRSLDWYRERFAGSDDNVFIDASTSYASALLDDYSQGEESGDPTPYMGVPERIAEHVPQARFIYLLRNPVARAYSSYWHNVRCGIEQRNFREAIADSSYYLRLSDYQGQLALYLEQFPLERFHVLIFEEFRRDPAAVARRCLRFLGLSDDVELRLDGGRHETFRYPGMLGQLNRRLASVGGLTKMLSPLKQLVPAALQGRIAGMVTRPVPPMLAEDRVFLTEFFAPRIALLEDTLGRSLDIWR
jgi:hypothetical protein